MTLKNNIDRDLTTRLTRTPAEIFSGFCNKGRIENYIKKNIEPFMNDFANRIKTSV